MTNQESADAFMAARLRDAMDRRSEVSILLHGGVRLTGYPISIQNGVFHMKDFSVYRVSEIAGIESLDLAKR
jgi:hypothetical protein